MKPARRSSLQRVKPTLPWVTLAVLIACSVWLPNRVAHSEEAALRQAAECPSRVKLRLWQASQGLPLLEEERTSDGVHLTSLLSQ